jgi:release factor glutamine methyltransferase
MDTPVYHDASSGDKMIREREDQFQRRYGFPSNALPSEGYLTYARLRELAVQFGVQWHIFHPWYGIRWAMRPWKAKLLRRREPARFLLIVGQQGGTETRPSSLRIGLRYASRLLLRARYRLFQRHRHRSHVLEHVAGYPIVVLPDVFNPALFRSGEFLAETLTSELVPQGAAVLDLGTGTGIGAVAAARWASRVVAVDINSEAVRCARVNALINDAEGRIDVREGDLFDPVSGERFDVVLFNPPYFHGEPDDWYDHAWRSTDVFDRFVGGLRHHLTPDGYALIVLSSDGESWSYLQSLRSAGYSAQIIARRDLLNEQMTIYRVHTE